MKATITTPQGLHSAHLQGPEAQTWWIPQRKLVIHSDQSCAALQACGGLLVLRSNRKTHPRLIICSVSHVQGLRSGLIALWSLLFWLERHEHRTMMLCCWSLKVTKADPDRPSRSWVPMQSTAVWTWSNLYPELHLLEKRDKSVQYKKAQKGNLETVRFWTKSPRVSQVWLWQPNAKILSLRRISSPFLAHPQPVQHLGSWFWQQIPPVVGEKPISFEEKPASWTVQPSQMAGTHRFWSNFETWRIQVQLQDSWTGEVWLVQWSPVLFCYPTLTQSCPESSCRLGNSCIQSILQLGFSFTIHLTSSGEEQLCWNEIMTIAITCNHHDDSIRSDNESIWAQWFQVMVKLTVKGNGLTSTADVMISLTNMASQQITVLAWFIPQKFCFVQVLTAIVSSFNAWVDGSQRLQDIGRILDTQSLVVKCGKQPKINKLWP